MNRRDYPRWGSSPRTRGAHLLNRLAPHASGIIPAYAGSTVERNIAVPVDKDHPRVRGEHVLHTYVWMTRIMDHPRVRGEHSITSYVLDSSTGSSPRTRGARQGQGAVRLARGIIPAYAGSTSALLQKARMRWDHPRVRGEHLHVRRNGTSCAGSSPRTRGALAAENEPHDVSGIIPAYAGSTHDCPVELVGREDHPRVRGEHAGEKARNAEGGGSSPRTRGARMGQPL